MLDKSTIIKFYTSDYELDGGSKLKKGDMYYEYYQSDDAKKPAKNPYSNNYDGLELSRNLLQKIGNEQTAIDSIENQYRQDTTSFNEALYFFGKNSANRIVETSMEDLKKIKVSTAAASEKAITVTCQLPIQWMLSSSTIIYAIFQDSSRKIVKVELKIDNSGMKKLRKESISECELFYSTGKINNDWKKNGYTFIGLELSHPLYPIELVYKLDLSKSNKNQIADKIVFRNTEYVIDKSKESNGKFLDSVMNVLK